MMPAPPLHKIARMVIEYEGGELFSVWAERISGVTFTRKDSVHWSNVGACVEWILRTGEAPPDGD